MTFDEKYLSEFSQNIDPGQITVLKLLGSGAFAKVYLIRYQKSSPKLMALKVLDKQDLHYKNYLHYATVERNVMA